LSRRPAAPTHICVVRGGSHARLTSPSAPIGQPPVGRPADPVLACDNTAASAAFPAEGGLSTDDVVLHWFTRDDVTGHTKVTTGTLDAAGAFGEWPEDFDEVNLEAEARYLDAAARYLDAAARRDAAGRDAA
jgi:hypothetical protein